MLPIVRAPFVSGGTLCFDIAMIFGAEGLV
jgi:hypothetical protein